MAHPAPMLYCFGGIFTLLPIVAVILRFYSRHLKRVPLLIDDWIILFSLLACIATGVLMILHTAIGMLGQHLDRDAHGRPIYDARFFMFQRFLLANDTCQLFAIGPTKVSVLFFYRRIFKGRRVFDALSWSLICLSIAWTITFFLTNLLQFLPIDGWWTKVKKKPSLNLTQMFLAQSYADVALDVIIISIPVPLIWNQMQMSIGKKIGVSFVFLLGSLTTGASIARTVVQYGVAQEYERGNPDRTYYLAPIIYWPFIEASLGIVAACLPLLRPILPPIKDAFIHTYRYFSSLRDPGQSSKSSSRKTDRDFAAMDNNKPDAIQNDRWLQAFDTSVLNEPLNRDEPNNRPYGSLA